MSRVTRQLHLIGSWWIFYMRRERGNYWRHRRPVAINKLTTWLDWSVDLYWWSFCIWIERVNDETGSY